MPNISVSCAEIESAVGFVFETLLEILNHTLNRDCDQSWYSEGGRLVADPSDPETLFEPAISVFFDHLVTSHCVNLNHEILCYSPDFSYETLFSVRNETSTTPNSDVLDQVTPSLQLSDQWWIPALFIIMVVLVLLVCFVLRERIFSCVSRAVARIFQCDDSENRDPESGESHAQVHFC